MDDSVTMEKFVDMIHGHMVSMAEGFELSIAKQDVQPSCSKCTDPGCCRQKLTVDLYEVIPLVWHLRENGLDTLELRVKLKAIGEAMEGASPSEWMDKYNPCVFLDDGRCSIYSMRPIRCRTYFVVSEPRLCLPPSGNPIKIIDDTVIVEHSMKTARAVHMDMALKESQFRVLRATFPRALYIMLEAFSQKDMRTLRSFIRGQVWPTAEKIANGWILGDNPFETREDDAG